MKVLLSWLAEFVVDLGDDVDAIGDRLSALGLAVESRETLGAGIESLVVAKVLDLRPHPDADRIQLVDVDPGDGNALQVCCGAFNMSVGDLIPFAPIGTVMPNGMEIAQREIRGQTSSGMCCSASEIGLGEDSDGIMLLTETLDHKAVGSPLSEALGIRRDTLWDLEVNANRPDAMSVAGVARDLAGAMGLAFAHPEYSYEASDRVVSDVGSVEIVDTELCGRFAARVLADVQIGPSPAWMQRRLSALGMRPINRIVDISNYVMLELGQPNHTYDLDLLDRGALRVRRASEGESIVTLDDVERTLASSD
ncbi:MAG: phenylalanine--tRNA ligase subunit beta, partial [Acidobacteria bacterium]|nr:phenylalanine--tRNA ligase subunit beta [Acidobacteriota bacterium]